MPTWLPTPTPFSGSPSSVEPQPPLGFTVGAQVSLLLGPAFPEGRDRASPFGKPQAYLYPLGWKTRAGHRHDSDQALEAPSLGRRPGHRSAHSNWCVGKKRQKMPKSGVGLLRF